MARPKTNRKQPDNMADKPQSKFIPAGEVVPAPLHEHTLPDTTSAELEEGEYYALKQYGDDPNDLSITSAQLMANYIPAGTTIIRATGPRTYVHSKLEAKPLQSVRHQRGLTPPFAPMGTRTNPMRPERRKVPHTSTTGDLRDNEFEDAKTQPQRPVLSTQESAKEVGGKTASGNVGKTPEQIERERVAKESSSSLGELNFDNN